MYACNENQITNERIILTQSFAGASAAVGRIQASLEGQQATLPSEVAV